MRVFSTASCTRLGELRRGIDRAVIFDVAISPDKSMLAVTSDKSTLHIFDMPPASMANPDGSSARNPSSTTHTDDEGGASQKWGLMGKIPFLPRVFSDEYSFASAPFETSDDANPESSLSGNFQYRPIPGLPGGKAMKGHVGWVDDTIVLVLGAGRDGRWERYELGTADDGRRYCVRKGWRRYLGLLR